MEDSKKVFCSEITRIDCEVKNNLYDLLHITPAQPLLCDNTKANETFEFKPNRSKCYIPNKNSNLKVKTVREIRNLFEQDVYSFLNEDLEKQQKFLLRNIRKGSSNDKNTQNVAKLMLNGNSPVTRSSWEMLSNINPEKHRYSKQYVLWNGRCIQVNGSKGGKNKFIDNVKYNDLKTHVSQLKYKPVSKKDRFTTKQGLLRNSLNVKFKPGPLTKKKALDISHQKHHMGEIEIVELPKPALDISPTFGSVLDPNISKFINGLRDENGLISQNWAELAVSALGTIKNQNPEQIEKKYITFDLNYKCGQKRLLMRRENEIISNDRKKNAASHVNKIDESSIGLEVQKIINDMLDSVEISLLQDSLFSTPDDSEGNFDVVSIDDNSLTKDKLKRKYCELDRLDVTVIKLPENLQKNTNKLCQKSFCTLGCVCDSLECVLTFKQNHCGLLDCMFGCKCKVSQYKNISILGRECAEIIPGLMKLDNEINSRLAKEEQKFHQTVIVSGENRILLKYQRRNWKLPKQYEEFYRNVNLKCNKEVKKILTVVDKRIHCENIEPWCMVHNLYKCFCEGKFTHSSICNSNEQDNIKSGNTEDFPTKVEVCENELISKTKLRPRLHTERNTSEKNRTISISDDSDSTSCLNNENCISARTRCYAGRKYNNEHYAITNRKILRMEKHDATMKEKMAKLINKTQNENSLSDLKDTCSNEIVATNELMIDPVTVDLTAQEPEMVEPDKFELPTISRALIDSVTVKRIVKPTIQILGNDEAVENFLKCVKKQNNLVTWIEMAYKAHKDRLSQGLAKTSLEAPKKGKLTLISWDFLLSRYREKKNLILVSKQQPRRIYLCVNNTDPYFKNCINIADIRFADLPNYPLTVRLILADSSENNDSFCILVGREMCWELIGCISKNSRSDENHANAPQTTFDLEQPTNENGSVTNPNGWTAQEIFGLDSSELMIDRLEEDHEILQQSDRSKWFLMTIEKDFTEIQFHKRGFYVKYDSIIQSINLARSTNKTVRLSSQDCSTSKKDPHFGLYATPNASEYCVFIGPYEIHDSLGIETVKEHNIITRQHKTRGVWIYTNKVDDVKVVNNPLLFIPSKVQNEAMVTLDSSSQIDVHDLTKEVEEQITNDKHEQLIKNDTKRKVVKPIKISRSSEFYHLTLNPMVKRLFPNKSLIVKKTFIPKEKTNSIIKSLLKHNNDASNNVSNINETSKPDTTVIYQKPVAEIAPQLKITSVFSKSAVEMNGNSKENCNSSGMLILKPDEINKRVLVNETEASNNIINLDETLDVENFLKTSTICSNPEDVLIISDGEDDEEIRDVWIECQNVKSFGWIPGRTKNDKLSFHLPGFQISDFYSKEKVFDTINQVLARKIFIPKKFKLEWDVKTSKNELSSGMLARNLDTSYLVHRINNNQSMKNKSKASAQMTNKDKEHPLGNIAIGIIQDLEEISVDLEAESANLWKKAMAKQDEIYNSLNVSDDQKFQMAQRLQGIMKLNETS